MLLDEGLVGPKESIIVLQPRRIAARMLGKRVAQERGEAAGKTVGYRVRHDHKVSSETRIEFVTEGILLQRLIDDPLLEGVGALVFDEFHERNLFSDVSFACALRTQRELRSDLALVVMSATLQKEDLESHMEPCAVLSGSGRTYPVDIRYAAQPRAVDSQPVWVQAAYHAKNLCDEDPTGSCLIFMPGAFEIHKTVDALNQHAALRKFEILPLYGDLPPAQQDAVLSPGKRPKIIVSTNVAETSLTIPGVTKVVDSGLARTLNFDPRRGLNTLYATAISRASADQRSGRAGRTAPGMCVRMWGESEHGRRPAAEAPEIQRIELSEIALTLLASTIEDVEGLPWLDQPDPDRWARALALLKMLGAIDSENVVTGLGKRMSHFPLHPRFSRMLCEAENQGCVDAVIVIAALVQGRSIILPLKDRRKDRERRQWWEDEPDSEKSDFIALLAIWDRLEQERFNPSFCREWGIHFTGAQQAARTAQQLIQQAERAGIEPRNDSTNHPAIARSILAGFPDQVGKRLDRGTLRCELVGNRRGDIRRESQVQSAPLFVATDIDERTTAKGVNTFINGLAAIEPAWLESLFPEALKTQKIAHFDNTKQALIGLEQSNYLGLVLEEKETSDIDTDSAAELFADKILSGSWKLKQWDHAVDQWIERVNCVAQWKPDSGISPIDDEGRRMILTEICAGTTRFKEVENKPVWPAVKAWLPDMLHPLLDHLAPETFQLPRRNKPIKLRYESSHPRAVVSSMVQDFYDLAPSALSICEGEVPLTIEMLAPNRRPVQLTNDLEGFWERSYPQIKKDLAGRYPKHEWR